ncbi:hypothetical protein H6G97_30055 [Nostoc flagelliforme FACHB-838]|uniref:Uncharacterized protein n=1 Tax=Nostoc flagelliforme FACHB-838 TaxID=2692904 RepID=A0ABR8DVX4_9NOSO|nr:hypothetical protein [Nostoc flagelliforme FACHB-838]
MKGRQPEANDRAIPDTVFGKATLKERVPFCTYLIPLGNSPTASISRRIPN